MAKHKPETKPGPEAERLTLAGDWKDRVKDALAKKKPADGWPDQEEPREEGESDGRDD